jgi:hypothetical protein
MKNGKRPSKQQKIEIKAKGLNPDNWLVVKNLPAQMEIQHRESKNLKVIYR